MPALPSRPKIPVELTPPRRQYFVAEITHHNCRWVEGRSFTGCGNTKWNELSPQGMHKIAGGSTPGTRDPREVRPWKGRFPLSARHFGPLGREFMRPLRGRESNSPFPGALPPAIKLRPSRARKGGGFFRSLFSPAAGLGRASRALAPEVAWLQGLKAHSALRTEAAGLKPCPGVSTFSRVGGLGEGAVGELEGGGLGAFGMVDHFFA